MLEAIRLSPRDALLNRWQAIAGYAKDYLGRYEEAIAWQRRSLDADPNNVPAHLHLAIALAHLGRLEEARAAAPGWVRPCSAIYDCELSGSQQVQR